MLDSDIYLPDNFQELMDVTHIQHGNLYSSLLRFDYYSYENLITDKHDSYSVNDFHGFFQLYIQSKEYTYLESNCAAECDTLFKNLFPTNRRIVIDNLIVKHLGRTCVNWQGRNNIDFIK